MPKIDWKRQNHSSFDLFSINVSIFTILTLLIGSLGHYKMVHLTNHLTNSTKLSLFVDFFILYGWLLSLSTPFLSVVVPHFVRSNPMSIICICCNPYYLGHHFYWCMLSNTLTNVKYLTNELDQERDLVSLLEAGWKCDKFMCIKSKWNTFFCI